MPTCYAYIRGDTKAARQAQADYLRGPIAQLVASGYNEGATFEDSAGSVRFDFLQRPGAARLNLALEPGDAVIVPTLSTAFVSTADFLQTLRVWEGIGAYLIVADVALDSRTPEGICQLTQLSAAAQLALAGKRERARQRERERIAAGGPCGRAPLGMKYVGKHGKRRLVPDVEEQSLLKRMASWRRRGLTLRAIWLHLLKHGATRRSTGKEWSFAAVARAVPVGERLLAAAGAETLLPTAESAKIKAEAGLA